MAAIKHWNRDVQRRREVLPRTSLLLPGSTGLQPEQEAGLVQHA